MGSYRPPVTRQNPTSSHDKAQFSVAVHVLREHVELGKRIPLYYTLPTGRSIEGLCDRLRGTASPIPTDVEQTLRYLAYQLSVPTPKFIDYDTCSRVVKELALRLALPFGQRYALLPETLDKSY